VGEGPADNQVTVFNCPLCGQTMKVSRELAGKKGKCNRCGATVAVPFDPADLKFEGFAELESSVQFIEFQETPPPIQAANPPVQETEPPRIETGGSTSGLVSLTAPVAQAPVESLLEVEPLETPPLEPQNPLGNLARAAATNRPAWKPVRRGRWALIGTLAILFVGPIFLGVEYRLSHWYSLGQTEKAQRESAEIDKPNHAPAAGPTASVIAPAPPANSAQIAPLGPTPVRQDPTTRETPQGDLAFAMHQVEETVKRMEKGQTAIFDQDLGDQVNEVLRLRGELGLPNKLICQPGRGPDTSGPLGPWNKLQAILHPEKYPDCEARVEKP
jgi:hypothetical protein